MHVANAKGLNPRNLEILSIGVLEMVDARSDYGVFKPGEDFIVFSDYEDLLKKLEFYLVNEAKRNKVAIKGQQHVSQYSMESCLCRMLGV